jgi:hypothetical protein
MLRRLILAATVMCAAQAHAGEAGKVIFVAGAAHVAARAGAEGAPVQEGELLSTGADGYLYVKTIDNGLFILRPNTKARIVAYHVDPQNPANNRIKLELLSGVARSKSGDAVKLARQNFRFNTPVAAIGVRGTDFTVYTDQDTSRVAVLTGGVVVSGFAGACSPEGGGPCEGAASRELSASQRGQLLQVKRGQAAPQLLQGASNAPDQVSPPRADEPVAKNGAADPVLDPKKSESLDKLVAQKPPAPPAPPVTMPPELPPVVAPPVVAPPVVTPPDPPPVVVVPVPEPQPETPPLPRQQLQWGRWAEVAGQGANIGLVGPDGATRMIGGNYVLFRTTGADYVPERGNVGFTLKNSEAYIAHSDPARATTLAQVQNGLLNIDFGKSTFVTSFDLVGDGQTFKMMADGNVSADGRFGNTIVSSPLTNNMAVTGMLSNENGGSAAYLFQRRLDNDRSVNGITVWSR